MCSGLNLNAGGALAAGGQSVRRSPLTEQRLGERSGEATLSDPLRTDEQIGMRHSLAAVGLFKQLPLPLVSPEGAPHDEFPFAVTPILTGSSLAIVANTIVLIELESEFRRVSLHEISGRS